MKRVSLILVTLSFVLLSGCVPMENDVQLARRIFNGLCDGKQTVENLIDWQRFTAIGADIGKSYSQLRTEKDRRDYKKAFFYNFSASFKSAGGMSSQFSNWRIKSQDSVNTVVAADTAGQNKVILFTISRVGSQRKLTAISWE